MPCGLGALTILTSMLPRQISRMQVNRSDLLNIFTINHRNTLVGVYKRPSDLSIVSRACSASASGPIGSYLCIRPAWPAVLVLSPVVSTLVRICSGRYNIPLTQPLPGLCASHSLELADLCL